MPTLKFVYKKSLCASVYSNAIFSFKLERNLDKKSNQFKTEGIEGIELYREYFILVSCVFITKLML